MRENIKGDVLLTPVSIKLNSKWSYVNEIGEMVIKPQSDDAKGIKMIFCSDVKRVKQFQEMVAQKKRIDGEKAPEEKRLAKEKAREWTIQLAN